MSVILALIRVSTAVNTSKYFSQKCHAFRDGLRDGQRQQTETDGQRGTAMEAKDKGGEDRTGSSVAERVCGLRLPGTVSAYSTYTEYRIT